MRYEGAKYMSETLKINRHLVSVRISTDLIGVDGIQYIIDAMLVNGSLLEFYIGTTDRFRFDEILKRNRKMHKRARLASLTLLTIRKFRKSELNIFPTDIIRMMAKYVWATRVEIEAWDKIKLSSNDNTTIDNFTIDLDALPEI